MERLERPHSRVILTRMLRMIIKKKKRVDQSVRWCFTFHNYTKKDIGNLNGAIGAKFISFSEERGRGGVGENSKKKIYT